jgi:hypothetical protein
MKAKLAIRRNSSKEEQRLRFLTDQEIQLIDELLSSVGEYGEVCLTIKGGKLRFASRTESYDALKWHQVDLEANG